METRTTRMPANADKTDFKSVYIRVWHIRVIRVPMRYKKQLNHPNPST